MKRNKSIWMRYVAAFVAMLTMSLNALAEDIILKHNPGSDNSVTITEEEDGTMTIVSQGGDPFFQLTPLPRDLEDNETFVMMEYQSDTSIPDLVEFFFSPIAGGREQSFEGGIAQTDEGEWRVAYLDITSSREKFGWGSKGDFFRFDLGNKAATIRIRNIRITTPPEYDRTEVVKIGTAEELSAFMDRVNKDLHFGISAEQTADIDFTAYNKRIANFQGTFNGAGHSITVNYNVNGCYAALFEMLYGTVENLIVKGTIATTDKYAGGIAGRTFGATIRNCCSLVDILPTISGDGTHGGIVGINASGVSIENCVFAGSIKSETTTNCAGYVGWAGARTILNNCVQVGSVDLQESDLNVWARCPQNVQIFNSYYLNNVASSSEPMGTQVTAEMVSNGALCFMLNGDQKNITWTQTLGTNPYPMPFTTYKQVYANGEMRCDGTPMGDITYSNEDSGSSIPDHQFGEDGVCSVCGTLNTHLVEPDEEGFLPLATAGQYVWFTRMVANNNPKLKGRLTADIDLSGLTVEPIGTQQNPYTGTFDGGLHCISGLNISKPDNMFVGLFGAVSGGVEIRNLILGSDCYIAGKGYVGLVGGSTGGGTATLTNLGNEGIVTGSAQNVAGIIGCSDGSACRFLMTNCYVTGNISGGNEAAAFSGWTGNQGSKMTNCWTTAVVEGTSGDNVYCARGESMTFTNCYSLYGTQVTGITEDAVTSGELCYKLNKGRLLNPDFYQTLSEDSHPVLESSHGIVYTADGEIYADIHDDATFKEFTSMVFSASEALLQDLVAQQSLIDQFKERLATLKGITDKDAFLNQYVDFLELKEEMLDSKQAYADYEAKMLETIDYLDEAGLTGPTAQKLDSYLVERIEPSEDYVNGSYPYIMERHVLDNEQLATEIATVDGWLKKAITEGFAKDTELTSLLVNADFSSGFEGWEGVHATGYGTNGNIRAAESYSKVFDMYQTLTGLQDGIYEFQVNGGFRPGGSSGTGNRYSTNLAASIYANGNEVYLPAVIEGMIPVSEAVDLENCWIGEDASVRDLEITDEYETELLGYVLHGVQSCCYAFQAGRYANSIVVEVTDGTLTLGIKNPGTGLNYDWTGFGNIKLFYRGTVDEATESIDRSLDCAVARANTLLAYTYDPADLNATPNFSNELRTRMREAIKGVETATTAAEKYALVGEFSDIFRSVYSCKKSYLKLALLADKIYQAYTSFITEDEELLALISHVEEVTSEAWAGYDGGYTQEEAEAMYERLKKEFKCDYLVPDPDRMNNSVKITNTAPFTYLVECQGGDPYVALTALEDDLAEDVIYMTFEYRSATNTRGEFFYSPIAAGRDYWYDILPATDEWARTFVDISAPRKKLNWGKAGDYLRWDIVENGYDIIEVRNIELITEAQKDILTSIQEVNSTLSPMAPADQNTYTIDGRMFRPGTSLRNLPSGFYIIGGKKYLVK
ncbi:MAG: hypothetical protein ACI4B5_07115 [Bacteroidaceae bacterium]